jgi:VWFA-related protein
MRTVSRLVVPVVAVVIGSLASLGEAGLPSARESQEPAPPRIRVAVEIVPVDVQVIDRTGRPVPNLGPDKFTVTINGKRRRVVSADRIGRDVGDAAGGGGTGAASAVPGRVIMLAVDCISFDATASRDVIESIGRFVRGLQPDDYVGLSAYPNGPQLAPTTDHAAIHRALATVVGQRDGPGLGQFNLRPTEIIDLSRDIAMGNGPTLERVLARECGEGEEAGPTCRLRLVTEVRNTALYYEGQATASLGMLRTLVGQMRGFPGRKTLLLVSGGMIASDSPGGRPDLGSLGMNVGREAAAANTAIYTLYVDSTLHDQFAAEKRTGLSSVHNEARDRAVLARWLEQFTGTAGGALFNVQVGNAESALARIHTELSSYYLLGVEPADEDRDGRIHEVSVKIRQSNVTIRGRRWVMIPKPGATAAAAPPPVPAPEAPSGPLPAPVPPRRLVPDNVAALAKLFDGGNGPAFQAALDASTDLSNVIRGLRMSDSPWPDDQRRTAIFALELALAGLRGRTSDVRDEAGRLLAEFHVRIRTPGDADAFECGWFVAEASALEGLFNPENALLFIPRALQRCPANGRLHLAHAVVSEQQWLRGSTTAAQDAEILGRYEEAMKFPDTEVEARVRAARFLQGLGQPDRALEMLDRVLARAPADAELLYFAHLFRGQVLRASGRTDDAAAAFRAALAAWPGAQSAQVALMTLLVNRGDREEAAAISETVQTASGDQYDPWWMYWLGDYRLFPTIVGRLSELGR